jgi:hypothetical protein
MSHIIVEPKTEPRREPVFTGTAARWGAAVLLATGAVLQLTEFLLEPHFATNAQRVAQWAAKPSRLEASKVVGLVAVAFLIGSVVIQVLLAKERSPRFAWTGGVLLTLAMTGLAAVQGMELMAYGLALGGDQAAAVKALDTGDLGLPGIVLMVMFLGGAMLGILFTAAAAWRSPYIPRAVPVLSVAFAISDLVLDQPIVAHALYAAAGLIIAGAVVRGYVREPRQVAQ